MQNNLRFKTVLTIFFVFLLTSTAKAQNAGADGPDSSDFSFSIGSMLPNQIVGVTEILPVFGGRYAMPTGLGKFELGGLNSHAEGVDFTTLEASLRGDIPIGDGAVGLIYAGVDFNWYSPKNISERQTETGFHIGTGAMVHVAENFWLRGEFKFMGGPGTSLYLLFGIAFRAPTGGAR
jgi:hypothetical protein